MLDDIFNDVYHGASNVLFGDISELAVAAINFGGDIQQNMAINDSKNNLRYDTQYGMTGSLGPAARSNLLTPSVANNLKTGVTAFLSNFGLGGGFQFVSVKPSKLFASSLAADTGGRKGGIRHSG